MATKKKTLSKLPNNSTPDLIATNFDSRRAVSHNLLLPDRTLNPSNAPWVPPQQGQRAVSANVRPSTSQLLTPLTTAADFHRKPLPNESSQGSLRAASATSSPVHSRPSSSLFSSHSPSPNPLPIHSQTLPVPASPNGSPTSAKKRKSWFGGGSKLSKSKGGEQKSPAAWVLGHPGQQPAYDLTPLITAQRVPELWNPQGDTFVYLFPRTSNQPASFRVDSNIFSSSTVLTELAHGKIYSTPGAGMSTASLAASQRHHAAMDHSRRPGSRAGSRPTSRAGAGTPPISATFSVSSASNTDPSEGSQESRGWPLGDSNDPGQPIHLYLPISLSADGAVTGPGQRRPSLNANDVDTLISARNLFAFLIGQSIVATERRNSIFACFLKIAELLGRFGFSNLDGSTYGEVAHTSFDSYVEELRLADVRSSREKTIESIVLGEKMRSVLLYNEAFVHGVGKWAELQELKNPKFDLISSVTRTRMERAALDLEQRKRNINAKLEDFDFPAIFAGIMNSKTADEAKMVRFDDWRNAFMSMRKWFMGYYRSKYGAWPPKASSKKNSLETSGLNRLVLNDLYRDLSSLYDLLVDRVFLTTRTTDMLLDDDDTEDAEGPLQRALRKVLNEYDRSTPPVQPPVPFDTPIIPMLTQVGDTKADAKLRSKKLKKEQLHQILRESYNHDANVSTPFLDAFKDFEYHEANGSTVGHVTDLRQGQWMFLYAVLQSLPMLVVDAPAVKWTHGVEYFLCMPPRSGVPWAREDPQAHRTFYAVAGSGGVVSLPSDVIEFGVEGIYRRSHCWEMAEKWTAHSQLLSNAVVASMNDELPPPPTFGGAGLLAPRSRSSSPGSDRSKRQSVMMFGLEALPVPGNITPDSPSLKPVASGDPSKTFDSILGTLGTLDQGKTKGKKK